MLRNRIYYVAKPFVPQRVRMAIRRQIALRRRPRFADVWPIMPGSERPPEGWPGWPEGKKFAVVLTHDVESQRGLDKCRALMELEMELGFRSSFNFIPEGDYRVPTALRDELTRNGFEVGVHDLKHDGRLFRSEAEFKARALGINQYLQQWNAVGFRSGFMLHNLDWLHALDIDYDMSTFDTDPFEPQPEGRHTIFPFWVPALSAQNSEDRRDFSLPASQSFSVSRQGYVELPYTLPQDSTLFLLLRETSAEIWLRKCDWIAAHGGMVLLDTHPDYMSFADSSLRSTSYDVRFYRDFLNYIRTEYSGSYWSALPAEVVPVVLKCVAADRAEKAVRTVPTVQTRRRLEGKHGAVVLFSHYPADPRPRRAAEALVAEGATIDMICLRDTGEMKGHAKVGEIDVFRYPLQRRRGGMFGYVRQYTTFLLLAFLHLGFRSRRKRYDFVHVHNMPDVLVFSAAIPKLLGAKVVLDLHDPMPELMQTIFQMPENSFGVRLLKKLEAWSIGFADVVLTVNLACKNIYSSRSCPPPEDRRRPEFSG